MNLKKSTPAGMLTKNQHRRIERLFHDWRNFIGSSVSSPGGALKSRSESRAFHSEMPRQIHESIRRADRGSASRSGFGLQRAPEHFLVTVRQGARGGSQSRGPLCGCFLLGLLLLAPN